MSTLNTVITSFIIICLTGCFYGSYNLYLKAANSLCETALKREIAIEMIADGNEDGEQLLDEINKAIAESSNINMIKEVLAEEELKLQDDVQVVTNKKELKKLFRVWR